MSRRLAALVIAILIGPISYALAQGGANGPSKDRLDYAPIILNVACGELAQPPCSAVLPKIAGRAAQSGVDLRPFSGTGALATFSAVCEGQAAAAIVQRDAVAYLAHNAACEGRYDIVGRAIYPDYAFLVVRADSPFRSFADLAKPPAEGAKRMLASPTGGQVTLAYLLKANPESERAIGVTDDSLAVGLEKIAAGTIDGYFSIETLNSDLIDRVRLRMDTAGKPLFRFIDVRPAADFLRNGDGSGHCLYRLTALDFGGRSPITTVSVDAVMVLGQSFRDAHARSGPRAPDALTSAIAATQTAVLDVMKSPRDWRPVITVCK